MIYVLIAAMATTVIALIVGIAFMARGGEINKKYSNKLMSLRVAGQAIAIALLFIIFASAA